MESFQFSALARARGLPPRRFMMSSKWRRLGRGDWRGVYFQGRAWRLRDASERRVWRSLLSPVCVAT
eukprot:10255174-Lingulodinium_polyedra.AAC.1